MYLWGKKWRVLSIQGFAKSLVFVGFELQSSSSLVISTLEMTNQWLCLGLVKVKH